VQYGFFEGLWEFFAFWDSLDELMGIFLGRGFLRGFWRGNLGVFDEIWLEFF
jgi:hypothetical protein